MSKQWYVAPHSLLRIAVRGIPNCGLMDRPLSFGARVGQVPGTFDDPRHTLVLPPQSVCGRMSGQTFVVSPTRTNVSGAGRNLTRIRIGCGLELTFIVHGLPPSNRNDACFGCL